MIENAGIYRESIEQLIDELKADCSDVTCRIWDINKAMNNGNKERLRMSADYFDEVISECVSHLSQMRDVVNGIKAEAE